jgi:pyrroloquinoline-quinone synthase
VEDRFALPAVEGFSDYPAVEAMILEWVRRWFLDAPFFVALRQGQLSEGELRYFAVQYGHYSLHFPRVLGAAVAAMDPSDGFWIPIADNLWDEAGRGDPERSHRHLYETFLQSIDPSLSLATAPMGPAVAKAVTTFLDFFRGASTLEAMAAVGLGSELFAGQVMGWLADGLSHPRYQRSGSLDLTFWRVHAMRDEPRHYWLCRDVLVRYRSPEALSTMAEVGLRIASSEARMYDEIYHESHAHS